MNEADPLFDMIDAIEELGIPYIVVGAYSVNMYATPRATKDADILIELAPETYRRLREDVADRFRFDSQIVAFRASFTHAYRILRRRSSERVRLSRLL